MNWRKAVRILSSYRAGTPSPESGLWRHWRMWQMHSHVTITCLAKLWSVLSTSRLDPQKNKLKAMDKIRRESTFMVINISGQRREISKIPEIYRKEGTSKSLVIQGTQLMKKIEQSKSTLSSIFFLPPKYPRRKKKLKFQVLIYTWVFEMRTVR